MKEKGRIDKTVRFIVNVVYVDLSGHYITIKFPMYQINRKQVVVSENILLTNYTMNSFEYISKYFQK